MPKGVDSKGGELEPLLELGAVLVDYDLDGQVVSCLWLSILD